MRPSKIIKYDNEFSKDCSKILVFFADINLKNFSSNTATTYQDLKDKVSSFNRGFLLTNQTSALSFDMFNTFDLIVIHNTSKSWLMFKLSEDGSKVLSTTGDSKELRPAHNLLKLWISCWQEL